MCWQTDKTSAQPAMPKGNCRVARKDNSECQQRSRNRSRGRRQQEKRQRQTGHAALLCRINSFAALTDMRGNKTNERASQIVATFPSPSTPVSFLHP